MSSLTFPRQLIYVLALLSMTPSVLSVHDYSIHVDRKKNVTGVVPKSVLTRELIFRHTLAFLLDWPESRVRTAFRGDLSVAAKQGLLQELVNTTDETQITDCYCEVRLNSKRNLKGEKVLCGHRNRIHCPSEFGCQQIMTVVNGAFSSIRHCGAHNMTVGCQTWREKRPELSVHKIFIRRCICMDRECNGTPGTLNFSTVWGWLSLWMIVLVLSLIFSI